MRYGYIILGVVVLLLLVGLGVALARNNNGILASATGTCPLANRPVVYQASAINTVRPATCPTAYQASTLGTMGYYPQTYTAQMYTPQTYANPYVNVNGAYAYQPLMPMTWYTAPQQGQYVYYTNGVPTRTTVVQQPGYQYEYNYQYQNQNVIPGQTQQYTYQYGNQQQQQGGTWYQ